MKTAQALFNIALFGLGGSFLLWVGASQVADAYFETAFSISGFIYLLFGGIGVSRAIVAIRAML